MSIIGAITGFFNTNPVQKGNNRQYVKIEPPKDVCSFSRAQKGDLEPNNPLNKYKPTQPFSCKYDNYGSFWNTKFSNSDQHLSPWKLHIYSDNVEDYNKLLDTIGPYLLDVDVNWKTFNNTSKMQELSGIQKGKAFTIYPSSNGQMAKIAQDIDYIVRNNGMQLNKTDIVGDRQMGDSGRIFYRYQYKSGAMQNVFLDMSDPAQAKEMHNNYDSNRGVGMYLATDMSAKDDPWLYFDPSHRPSPAERAMRLGRYTLETCERTSDDKFKLLKNVLYPINGDEKVYLHDCEIDLSHPSIRSKLNALPNMGTFTMGRSEDASLPIPQGWDKVSRSHANIYRIDGQLYIHDFSTNGTSVKKNEPSTVNGYPVKSVESCPKDGSVYMLDKGGVYPLKNISNIMLPGTNINMNNAMVRQVLMRTPEGQFAKIGRAEDCEIRLDGSLSNISRHHANIYRQNNRFYIQDISMNGTGLVKRSN